MDILRISTHVFAYLHVNGCIYLFEKSFLPKCTLT